MNAPVESVTVTLPQRTLLELFAAGNRGSGARPLSTTIALNAIEHAASTALLLSYPSEVDVSDERTVALNMSKQLEAAIVLVEELSKLERVVPQQEAAKKASPDWEASDFNACIRDVFEHFEAVQSMSLSCVKESDQAEFAPHLVALGAHLAELRDRLATEIVWEARGEAAE